MNPTTPNRVQAAIDRLRPGIAALKDSERATIEKATEIDFNDHYGYQQAQARAHANGDLTVDEAQIIYAALGENFSGTNGGWAANTDLVIKLVITKTILELMKAQMEATCS